MDPPTEKKSKKTAPRWRVSVSSTNLHSHSSALRKVRPSCGQTLFGEARWLQSHASESPRAGLGPQVRKAKTMRTQRQITRRAILWLGLAVVGKQSKADDQPTENPNKITQAVAEYQPTPKGMFSCAVCTFFIKPKGCKVVDGEVSPAGWCKLFDMVD